LIEKRVENYLVGDLEVKADIGVVAKSIGLLEESALINYITGNYRRFMEKIT
jgi:hypothetical protein